MIVDALAAVGRRATTGRDRDVGRLDPPVEDLMMTEMFHGTFESSASHNLKNFRQRERRTDRRVFS